MELLYYLTCCCEKMCMTIKVFIFCIIFTQRTTSLPKIGLWTLRPRFLRGFTSP